jgi:DNA-binding GntR family transcriptional regulator
VIEAAVQACRNGYTSGDNAQFEQGDDAFHLGVATASHNFFLLSAVREARMLQRQGAPSFPGGTLVQEASARQSRGHVRWSLVPGEAAARWPGSRIGPGRTE